MLTILKGYLNDDASFSQFKALKFHHSLQFPQAVGHSTWAPPTQSASSRSCLICLDILNDSGIHRLLESITTVHVEGVASVLLGVVTARFTTRVLVLHQCA